MPKRAISQEDCVLILKDFITEKYTLKDLSKKYGKSLSSVSKLVNFKSPYLLDTFDESLAAKVENIDIRQLGTEVRDSREKKKPVIDYDKINEEGRKKRKTLGPQFIKLIEVGFKVNQISKYFNIGETSVRNWIREIEPEFFTTEEDRKRSYNGNTPVYSTEYAIEKFREVHGDKYGYGRVECERAFDKVEIFCYECDRYFKQTAGSHGNGSGCKKCAQVKNAHTKMLSNNEFIRRSKKRYGQNTLGYDRCNYKGKTKKVELFCYKHGYFEVVAGTHLSCGTGCPRCSQSRMEKFVDSYLCDKNIEFEVERKFEDCKSKTHLRFDFFIESLGLLLEIQGVQHFRPIGFFRGQEGFEDRQKRDKIKYDWAQQSPYNLEYINYDDDVEHRLEEILKSNQFSRSLPSKSSSSSGS